VSGCFLVYCIRIALRERLHRHASALTLGLTLVRLGRIGMIEQPLPATDGGELLLLRRTESHKECQRLLSIALASHFEDHVERGFQRFRKRVKPASSKTARSRDSPPIEIKIPEGDKRSEYMQVMCDLNVLAFQTDTTRVSTYIGSTPNGVSYPELGFSDMHHAPTHHNHEAEKVNKVAAITAFNISQFAYIVKKMASLREGDGTLLDNCLMMWGFGLEDGNKHTRENLPVQRQLKLSADDN